MRSFVDKLKEEFRPLPFLGNPHVQTVLGAWLKGPDPTFCSRARRVLLTDGDQLVVHDSRPGKWRAGAPIALLVHGLAGTHRSGYMQRLAEHLLRLGLRVVRLDLRGSGRGLALARRSYHAGCSDDVRAVAKEVQRWSPASPLVLVGFSLGGNIVLKLAGEAASAPVPGLARVAAVAPPIDLERCSARLALGHNRFYELHFLRELATLARRRKRFFPELPTVPWPDRNMTLRRFDDLYTAPWNGFAGVADYYFRASSLPLVSRIPVPTLILTARDDPFIAVESFDRLSVPAHVELRIVPHGGHLGFLGWDGTGGIRWADRQVAAWAVSGEWWRGEW